MIEHTNFNLDRELERLTSLKDHRDAFQRCREAEFDSRNVEAASEYWLVDVLEGVDHFDENIWSEGIRCTTFGCANDYAVLYCGGRTVRATVVKHLPTGERVIANEKMLSVPEWK